MTDDFLGAIVWIILEGGFRYLTSSDSANKSTPFLDVKSDDFRKGKLLFLEFVFQASANVARSKGSIESNDITALEKIFEDLKLPKEVSEKAIGYFNNSNNEYTLEHIIESFAKHFPTKEPRLMMFDILKKITLADGYISSSEISKLEKVIEILALDATLLND